MYSRRFDAFASFSRPTEHDDVYWGLLCGIILESTTVKASQRLRFQFCVVFPFFILIKCDFGILAFDITVEARIERGKTLAF